MKGGVKSKSHQEQSTRSLKQYETFLGEDDLIV
jgi:hypothetical protein